MKVGMFAVIPAEVRYDSLLSDKSKLLYAEIAASTNTWGLTEEDNDYFAAALKADRRTITKCIAQLINSGHIIALTEKGRRKLKVVLKGLPLPESPDLKIVAIGPSEESIKSMDNILSFWEMRHKFKYTDREAFRPLIMTRLKTFTEQEIMTALSNRCEFINKSEWYRQNPEFGTDIQTVIESDDTLLSWLNN